MFFVIDGNIVGFFTSMKIINCNPIPEHLHGSFEILVVTKASICVTVNENTYTLNKGEGIFINSFENHSITDCEDSVFYALMFTKETTHYFYNFLKENSVKNPIFPVSDESIGILKNYLPERQHMDDMFRAQAVLSPIIFDLREGCTFVQNHNKIRDSFYSILEYMSIHATEPITLETVGKAMGRHPSRISSCLNKYSSSNFNTILNKMRCSYAVSAMQNTSDVSITEIAYQSGFGSIRTFNRVFLSIYGVTPTEFKQNLR